jgi:hypothetical protein
MDPLPARCAWIIEKTGRQCTAFPMRESAYCFQHHAKAAVQERPEAGQGAAAAFVPPELLARLREAERLQVEELEAVLRELLRSAAEGTLAAGRATEVCRVVATTLQLLPVRELQRRLQAALREVERLQGLAETYCRQREELKSHLDEQRGELEAARQELADLRRRPSAGREVALGAEPSLPWRRGEQIRR